MTRFFRRTVAAFVLALGCSAPALASTHSPDFTDLWYNTAESGWGFNVIQQGNTLFGTLFVYGSDNSARWFVADAMLPVDATGGTYRFNSKFYRVTGPYYAAGTFNTGDVNVTEVGQATITFTTATTATLVYSVGADTVTKTMTRQTFRNNTPVGSFVGGMTAITSACADNANNGLFADFLGFVTGTLTGSTAGIRLDYSRLGAAAVCSFTGTYSQQGRLATVSSGTWTCSQGSTVLNNGTFTITNLDAQVNGLTAGIVATDQICTYTGRIGGLRNVTN